MTTLRRCIDLLERNGISYVHTRHPGASRARAVAAAERLSPHMLAKTVIVHGPDGFAMAVLPADRRIDLEELSGQLHVEALRLATTDEIGALFPECELGAMPPFGASFHMPVYLDVHLSKLPELVFNAGTHRDAIHLATEDYLKLAHPMVIHFAHPESLAEAKK